MRIQLALLCVVLGIGTAAADQDDLVTAPNAILCLSADSLETVRGKLALWRALAPGTEDESMASPRNRLVLSVETDIERLLGRVSA